MSDHLTLIRHLPHVHGAPEDSKRIVVNADRHTLAKRRFRARAADGREFGFDLDAPLAHHAIIHLEGKTHYVIEQEPEPVLEIAVATLEEAATIAWQIGNLHLGVQVLPAMLRAADDPAVVQMLEREGLAFSRHSAVFQPVSGGGGHHHHGHGPHAHE